VGMALITRYGAAEHWLAALVTMRGDERPSVSVVNAAPLAHPVTSEAVVGLRRTRRDCQAGQLAA